MGRLFGLADTAAMPFVPASLDRGKPAGPLETGDDANRTGLRGNDRLETEPAIGRTAWPCESWWIYRVGSRAAPLAAEQYVVRSSGAVSLTLESVENRGEGDTWIVLDRSGEPRTAIAGLGHGRPSALPASAKADALEVKFTLEDYDTGRPLRGLLVDWPAS